MPLDVGRTARHLPPSGPGAPPAPPPLLYLRAPRRMSTSARLLRRGAWLTLAVVLTCGSICSAGPPFVTDDPEPVPFKHYELYLGGTYARLHEGESAVAPLVEFNFGALPDLQLHIVAPIGHMRPETARPNPAAIILDR